MEAKPQSKKKKKKNWFKEYPFRPVVDVVLVFLTELFELGLGYSALNTARSVISAVMQLDLDFFFFFLVRIQK